MAKYTVEVEGVYALTIISAVVELLESKSTKDADYLSCYLDEAMDNLLGTLVPYVRAISPGELTGNDWVRIANHAEELTKIIRVNLEDTNG